MLTMALQSCSPKKNNAATRNYQAFITRYNIHYNGDTHYKETLKEMESAYEDDYSRLLFIHPAEAKADTKAPQPSGNFDRSIEKAQKAIQLRSIKKKPKKKTGKSADAAYKEWMKRDEYNPFLHNSWLMMGRSQYNNGDFLGAASTFFYISKHFTWLPNTVTESKLWEARSYCAMDWLFEAESILSRVKDEQLTNKTIKSLYYTTYADYYMRSQDFDKAITMLEKGVKLVSGTQKIRLNFLLGQLYARVGRKTDAYQAFKRAGGNSNATYRTQFNARIKQSEVYEGADIKPEVNALKRMVKYDRNKEYLDQVYYAIGNLYLSRKDTVNAIENYELAAAKSTRNGIDKAISQLTLGGLYYDLHKYSKAQPCYSEAIPQIPDTWPNYKMLKKRSDLLDELAVYSQNVELQDSLLTLAAMSPDEQLAVVNKIIDALKKKEKEEAAAAAREEALANRDANGLTSTNTQTFTMNTGDDSWYFYNTATKNAGRTEFQKKWGSRKLEDDWRRRNKTSFNFNDFSSGENEEEEGDETADNGQQANDSIPAVDAKEQEKANDPHFPEYYLKQIPKTDEEKQTANDVIQEGLYNMGVILKDKLEDFSAAEEEFTTLLTRYPDNVYRLDTYYNLYLMFMRAGNTARAEVYRSLILSEFADSKYGMAMKDPDYVGNLRRTLEMENEYYDTTLQAYFNNENRQVHKLYKKVSEEFPLSKLMPKFMFLEALAYVSDRDSESFKSTLMQMLERYPDTDIAPYASSYLKGLAQGKTLQQGSSNMRGLIWDIRLSNDSTLMNSDTPLEFDLNPEQEQYLVLLYPTDIISQNGLLYEVARHNFTSFVVKDFDLEQMNFGRLGLLIIKGFSNVAEINHYRQVMASSQTFQLPKEVRPVVISAQNFDTLLKSGRSFDDYFSYMRDKTYRDTEESVLPPELFGESDGLSPEEASEKSDEVAPTATPEAAPEEPMKAPEETLEVTSDASEETQEETPEVVSEPETGEKVEATEAEEPIAEEPKEETPQFEQPNEESPTIDEPQTETPKADEPTTEVPKAETPKVEAPKVEAPKVETPVTAKPTPTPTPTPQPQQPSLPEYAPGSEGDDPLLD
jgi:tetratricopeptide (TPR) repeat protein